MNFLKKNVKLFLGFIIGLILASGVAVYAYSYYAKDISYTKPGANTEINVEVALNDLYSKLDSMEYQKLNYIENDGTQYIDTGVKIKGNSVVKMHFKSISNSENYALYGASNGSAYNNGEFSCFWNNTLYDVVLPSSNTASSVVTRPSYNANTEYNIEQSFSYFKVNGTTYNISGESTYQGNRNMYIFTVNRGGGLVYSGAYKLYGMEIYEGETKVRDFKPCFRKSDCAVGLYDEVTKTFFTNSGSGTFKIG